MRTNATPTRTSHNGNLVAVRHAVLRSGNRRAKQLRKVGESINYASASSGQASTGSAQAGFTLATSTSYNSLGQKSSTTYPDGAVYSYTYDSNNQLNILNLPTGYGSITYNSYLWSAPAQITLPGGTVRGMSYDGLLRLKDLNVKDPGQSQVMSYQYRYDATNNIVAKATEAGTTNYSYDTLDHLTGAAYSAATGSTSSPQAGSTGSPQATEAYSYDPVANRTSSGAAGSPQSLSYTYNENNQLLSAGNGSTGSPTGSTGSPTVSYSYDANGNTASQSDSSGSTSSPQARNYVYDTSDRLVEVRDGGNALIAVYSYDPFGRRLSKDTGTKKIYYLYNEEGLIAEADASGQLTKSYGYAPGGTLRPSSGQAFMTNPLWMKSGNGSTGSAQAYYAYQNDHLGTPQKLLTQSGQTVWSATYDAFGNATIDPAYTIVNNLRNPGQYYDAETGLHYNWMRYYDPKSGRYWTSDPIGLKGGINLYTYVLGNPLSYVDPTGLALVPVNLPGLGATYLDDAFLPSVQTFINNAAANGVNLNFNSAYRTPQHQAELRNDPNAITPADHSLHSCGFAVDINYSSLTVAQQQIIRNAASAAGLNWGGNFQTQDPPHFYIEPSGGRDTAIQNATRDYLRLTITHH